MQFKSIMTTLALAMGANAAISLGQQFRGGSINYWVAWTEGTSPCGDDTAIGLLSDTPCGKNFYLDGHTYYLSNCNSDQFALYNSDGTEYGECNGVSDKKITCSGDVHDVIKHYICG